MFVIGNRLPIHFHTHTRGQKVLFKAPSGQHTVTAIVSDSFGASVEYTMTLNVPSKTPQAIADIVSNQRSDIETKLDEHSRLCDIDALYKQIFAYGGALKTAGSCLFT